MNRFKGYLNEAGRKLAVNLSLVPLWFKGYLNEVGRKLTLLYRQVRVGLKGYLNEVGRKRLGVFISNVV